MITGLQEDDQFLRKDKAITKFTILFLVMLVVYPQTCGEYIVYNDTQLTLQGIAQAC